MNTVFNALVNRDRLFSRIHASVFKSQGFKKNGHWCIKSNPPFHWAVYLRASRFGTSTDAVFWLDLVVFHETFTRLVTGSKVFPGTKESTLGLVREDLGDHCSPMLTTISIRASTDLVALEATLTAGAIDYALPLFEKCRDLENILDYFASHPKWPMQAYSAAGVALLLRRDDEASRFFALDNALGGGEQAWLERRERAMRKNWRELQDVE